MMRRLAPPGGLKASRRRDGVEGLFEVPGEWGPPLPPEPGVLRVECLKCVCCVLIDGPDSAFSVLQDMHTLMYHPL